VEINFRTDFGIGYIEIFVGLGHGVPAELWVPATKLLVRR
jgi:hypothetical protein